MRAFYLIFCFILFVFTASAEEEKNPLMKDFIGINGHFDFKPSLYSPVCSLVRNYQNISWDVQKLGDSITFPVCHNKVNWEVLYKKWQKQGFEISACAIFGSFGEANKNYQKLWEGKMDWVEKYGYEMAKVLSKRKLATSIEIGNELGSDFDDELYQKIFRRMASGIRKADPKMKIVTCTVHDLPADKYHKNLRKTFASRELISLFDVINLHVYAEKAKKNQAHPWERSYPEDPGINYLTRVDDALEWRDKNAPGKEVWITEFGYDSCTKAAMKKREGWFKKLGWTGVNDLQQAQWLTRSLLCFAERGIDRAYIYFYNDKDKAATHAAAGLTRNFKPKPSYWAIKQYYELLGDFRFNRILRKEEGRVYAHEFMNDTGKLIWVLWSPTGQGRSKEVHLRQLPSKPKTIIPMSTETGDPEELKTRVAGKGIIIEVGESPVYIVF